jgi:NADPH-dependent 2,4-dienoyl-CoA reductase/sulfur reductase-like enzyme
LTAIVQKELARIGVEVHLNHRVSGPEALAEDLIVPALGLVPNVRVAAEAGVVLGRTGAIAVSERMETNLGGVYAAGDCAETLHRVSGRPAWIPLGTTANKMGRIAGANAAGRRERFAGITGTSIVRVGGNGIGVTGFSEAQARREGFQSVSAHIAGRDRPGYFWGKATEVMLVGDRVSGRLVGGAVTGEAGVAGRLNVIASALASKMTVEEFSQLDLAYAPPYAPVMDPLLIAAQQLLRQL